MMILTLLIPAALPCRMTGQSVDHSTFDMLCGMYVQRDGTVQYDGFRTPAFSRYIHSFASIALDELSPDDRLATLVNVYNACVIQNVLDHAPISSVMDVPGFFDEQKFQVAGRQYSLREIERMLVLPSASPLVHFALTAAARAAPQLPRSAFSADGIHGQFRRAAERFVRDSTRNRLDRSAGILYLSMVFCWYREDFELMSGSLRQFALHFLDEDDARWLADNETDIQFLPWDWSLNERQP
jgi:hypothetical protein